MQKFFVYPFAVSGLKTTVPDPSQISNSVSYQDGFTVDYTLNEGTDSAAKAVPLQQTNQIFYDISTAIREIQSTGTPDFITSTLNDGTPFSYPIFSRVRYNAGGGIKIYESQIDNNTTLPSDPSWAIISGNNGGVLIGTIISYAGGSVASNYLLCDGSAISRATYASLFAIIGTLWGIGDGSTTFNIPDSRRKTEIGSGGTGTIEIGNSVGDSGGGETVTQDVTQVGAHTHTISYGSGGNVVTNGTGAQGFPIGGGSLTLGTSSSISTTPTPSAMNIVQPSNVVTKMIKFQ